MRICFLGAEIAPTKEGVFTGGLVNNVIRLSRALYGGGHQVYIITNFPRYHRSTSGNWTIPCTEVYPFEVKGHYASILYFSEFAIKSITNAVRLNQEENFNILNMHGGKAQLGLIFSVLRKMISKPLVFTLYCPLTSNILGLCLSHVSAVIAISKNVKMSLIKAGFPSKKIAIIPPAVDTSVFNPSVDIDRARKNLGICEDDSVVMFLGNTAISKGIDDLLIAMRFVSKKVPSAKLIMVLDRLPIHLSRYPKIGSKIRSLKLDEKMIELGVSQNVHEIMAACDVFVAPFRDTAGPADIPLSILEAMAVGKPVVATNVGGIPEIISNNYDGMLVPPKNPLQLAEAIVYLLQNPDIAKKISRNASVSARENFSVRKVVRMTENIYNEIS